MMMWVWRMFNVMVEGAWSLMCPRERLMWCGGGTMWVWKVHDVDVEGV